MCTGNLAADIYLKNISSTYPIACMSNSLIIYFVRVSYPASATTHPFRLQTVCWWMALRHGMEDPVELSL